MISIAAAGVSPLVGRHAVGVDRSSLRRRSLRRRSLPAPAPPTASATLHAPHAARCAVARRTLSTLQLASCRAYAVAVALHALRRRCHVATLRAECVKVTRYRLAHAGGDTMDGVSYRTGPRRYNAPILDREPPRYLLHIASNVKKTIDTYRPLRIIWGPHHTATRQRLIPWKRLRSTSQTSL
jgi:hypothetical protein